MVARHAVSLAILSDEEPLLGLLRDRHTEEGIGPFDALEALEMLRRGIRREQAVIYVIRGRSEIEGSVGLYFSRPQFSIETVLADQWLFVKEPYRKSDRAKELVDHAKAAAVALGMPLMMSVNLNERTTRKEQFLSRQLPRGGSYFLFRPEAA